MLQEPEIAPGEQWYAAIRTWVEAGTQVAAGRVHGEHSVGMQALGCMQGKAIGSLLYRVLVLYVPADTRSAPKKDKNPL
jgi:hypothetical protein